MSQITNSISVCFSKFATFKGRASRAEFWWFFLFGSVVLQILNISQNLQILVEPETKVVVQIVNMMLSLTISIPSIACGSRRLHDIGKSGWWQLLMITIVGLIPLVIWWSKKGNELSNKYDVIEDDSEEKSK